MKNIHSLTWGIIAFTALIITGYFVELLTFEFSALLLLALLVVEPPS